MQIILSKQQKQILENHAKSESPYESCALLFGKKSNNLVTVSEIFLTQNMEHSSVNFTVSPDELIQAYSQAEKLGMDVVGIFHSHPSSEAYPSTTDKKFMEINPVVWIIYSGVHDDFNAFLFDNQILDVQIAES